MIIYMIFIMNEEEEEKEALLSKICLILWYFLYLYHHCYKKSWFLSIVKNWNVSNSAAKRF